MVIVFQQPKKKKNYFTTKKSCAIREAKVNLFATTVK